MEKRIALIGIIVDDLNVTAEVNQILHSFSELIIGRLGVPYRQEKVSIISVVLHGEADEISALAGKLGMIKGISVKTMYSKYPQAQEIENV